MNQLPLLKKSHRFSYPEFEGGYVMIVGDCNHLSVHVSSIHAGAFQAGYLLLSIDDLPWAPMIQQAGWMGYFVE